MGKRRPERDEAYQIWRDSKGEIKLKDLAEQLGVSAAQIYKWKKEDHWILKKPRGAPKGNQNSKGHGAPKGNQNSKGKKNAETHGAYSTPDEGIFSEEEQKEIDAAAMHSALLKELTEKRIDLRNKIRALEEGDQDKFITGGINGKSPIEYWDSKIKYMATLELEYNRVVGRILKVFDQIQAKESLKVHAEISRENTRLQREKAMGVFGDDDEEE